MKGINYIKNKGKKYIKSAVNNCMADNNFIMIADYLDRLVKTDSGKIRFIIYK